ncbi:hypothetical protein HMPREF1624_03933 [Sporothrix schenckii ATCC 58251]|uniref:Xylanolytic transcriptional activator regulatory domain-containing protein n=1 Tax=Sporothrix schenckii (strain ATCC 58251 / de Perez 2211183) TaxID=1391915 RepID=U7PY37_SPOS1|nr:hypothetical protein HMPREF1624_03933 [Sporothrix schenckii ATCC 58251]
MNTTSILFGTSNLAPVPHPEPRMILHLWQTFIDSVNPVMRIVHVPTTHKQIVDASWDPANAPPATGALMFAVYALALTSMTISEYADMFTTTKTRQTSDDAVPPKRELLTKYRMGAMQCLVAAGILTTRRLDVLRAFTLFILAEPDSELCSTLASTAVHLGLKLGLHRETSKSTPEGTGTLSFFDREMSVRLWWQILGIDARMRLAVSLSYTNSISTMGSNKHSRFATGGNYFGSSMPLTDLVDLRLPLNVNDADLHPDMTCAPVEHAGPTEMLYVRVKYHTAPWMQTFAQKKFVSSTSGDLGEVSTPAGHLFHTQTLPAMKNCAIDELEQLYTNICHQFADPRIPLHAVSSSMARMAVAQLRFQAYHPRTSAAQPPSQPPSALANGEQVSVIPAFSRYNADATFKHALSILEMCFGCRQVAGVGNGFAAFQLLADLVMRVVMDAIVYVLCMLRVRTCGENDDDEERAKIDSAWRMIELFYKEYAEDLAAATSAYEPHLLHMHHNASHTREPRNNDATTEENRKLAAGATFVAAFTDLTLEAFDAHEKAWLGLGKGALITPEFIAELRAQKNTQREFLDPSSAAGTGLGEMLLQADDFAMDWEYLNNLLQI